MQFVLNTSFAPHFCALFTSSRDLIDKCHWDTPKEDGSRVWDFLNQHLEKNTQLTFIGAVSGPGSFSSLRAGGAIMNALAFKFDLPIHQARADLVLRDYLASIEVAEAQLVLNSFGNRIFISDSEDIKPIELESNNLNKTQPTYTAWLPENKANQFSSTIDVDPLGPLSTILETLKNQPGNQTFIPDYEYPAVQP